METRRFFVRIAVAIVMLVATGDRVSAQWSFGLRGGLTNTTITRYDAGRMDERYSAQTGFEGGVSARYALNHWFALRADVSLMGRSHRMDRELNYLDKVYTRHLNQYLMVPVVADFSFGGEVVRGHLLAGGYAGYWLQERREGTTYWMTDYYVYFEDFSEVRAFDENDARWCGGITAGVGITATIGQHWEAGADVMYYYDLSSHHRGYKQLQDPRYLNTLALTISINYKL